MKQKITLLILLTAVTSLQAQINGGFELLKSNALPSNWSGVVYPKNVSIDLNGNSVMDSIIGEQDMYKINNAQAYSGNYALQLGNAYNFSTDTYLPGVVFANSDTNTYLGFQNAVVSVSGRPNSLEFYSMFQSSGNDTAMVTVRLFNENLDEIATEFLKVYISNNQYEKIEVPINYISNDQAAYAEIMFTTAAPGSESHLGTTWLIDEVNFTNQTSMSHTDLKLPLSLAPNPASYEFQILLQEGSNIKKVLLLDNTGRRVPLPEVYGTAIDVRHVYEGIYMLIVTTNEGSNTIDKEYKLKLVIRR